MFNIDYLYIIYTTPMYLPTHPCFKIRCFLLSCPTIYAVCDVLPSLLRIIFCDQWISHFASIRWLFSVNRCLHLGCTKQCLLQLVEINLMELSSYKIWRFYWISWFTLNIFDNWKKKWNIQNKYKNAFKMVMYFFILQLKWMAS